MYSGEKFKLPAGGFLLQGSVKQKIKRAVVVATNKAKKEVMNKIKVHVGVVGDLFKTAQKEER